MSKMTKTIIQEVLLSFVVAMMTVIVVPQVFDAKAAPNYALAFVVFLAMSAAFVAYETLSRNKRNASRRSRKFPG